MAGAWGLTGCWSFYPFKILGGDGDGGAITTNDPDVVLFATRMRYNGEDRDSGESTTATVLHAFWTTCRRRFWM